MNVKSNNYNSLKKFCNRHRIQYIAAKIVNSWLLLAGLLFGVGAVLSIAFSFFPWTALPVIFDAAVVIILFLCLGIVIKWTLIHIPALYDIASILENRIDKKHQYLLIALELGGAVSGGSSQLVEKVCAEAKKTFGNYPERIRNVVSRIRIYALCLAAVAFCVAIFLCTPKMLVWWDIPFSIFTSIQATISPGKIAVPKNTQLILQCVPEESVYPSAKLSITEVSQFGSASMHHLLRPDSVGRFTYKTDSLTASIIYAFTLGNTVFGPETVTVIPPPVLYSFKVTLKPPAYTRRPQVQLPEGQGSIAAYAGTRADFFVGSIFPLKTASYIHENRDTASLDIIDGNAHGELRLWNSGKYTFALEDSMSQKNDSLPSFYINILPDYEPNVRIVKPGINKILSIAQQESLWVEAVDDFGIKELILTWKKSSDDIDTVYKRSILPSGRRKKLVRRQVAWDLTELSLYPGDSVFYWVRTRDNRPYGKPQICISDTFFFRLPTFAEIHQRIAGIEDDAGRAMSSVQKLQEEMKDRLESLIKSAKGKESLSWEEKKIVEDLGNSIREQADSLNKAIKSLQKAVEKMKESSSSNDILDKMNELQKAVQELVKEYGDSLLFKPPGLDEKLSWRDMEDAVEKMTEMLPDLMERLDNALKYLEMLKKETERAMLAQQAKKLAEQQMQIAESGDSEEERLRRQKDLTKRTEDFLQDAQDKLADDLESPVSMQDIPSMEQVSSLQKSMQSNLSMQQMPSNSLMNQMSAALQGVSEELEATLSSNMAAKAMKDREMLLDMAQDVMNISQWQDSLAESVDSKTQRKMSATEQQALKEALQKSMNKLDSLEIVPPSMLQGIIADAKKAAYAIKKALQSMNSYRAGSSMKKAVYSLNGLAGTLLSSANSIKLGNSSGQGGGMGGMMCGLRRLSAKQAAINSATSEMLRMMLSSSGNKAGMSGSGKNTQLGPDAENARLAAQNAQKKLADQLNQLTEKYGKSSESSLRKRVKELEEEARRIAQMLDKPIPQVSERQDRFLVRMLQTTLSLHKQDKGKEKRKSKSAVTIFSTESVESYSDTFNKTDTFYNLRMKAMDGNFPDSYRSQVQVYFDSLGVLFLIEK